MCKLKITAPEDVPESGWIPITQLPDFGEGQPFLTGDTAGNRLVAYFLHETNQPVYARAWFGWAAEGPPGNAHGGNILAVIDEIMGLAAWTAGYLAVAVSITVQFRRKVPLGTDAIVEASVCNALNRKVFTRAKPVSAPRPKVFVSCNGPTSSVPSEPSQRPFRNKPRPVDSQCGMRRADLGLI